MTPKADGYGIRSSLKRFSPATLERDGADVYETSCGGVQDGFSPTENALYTRRIHAAGACSFPVAPTLSMAPGYVAGNGIRFGVGCP